MDPSDPIMILAFLPKNKAKQIQKHVVNNFKAASINIFAGPVNSLYRWLGKVEKAGEVAFFVSTTREHFDEITNLIKRHHPYELPAIMEIKPPNELGEWIKNNSTKLPELEIPITLELAAPLF